MPGFQDLTGNKYNRLTVLERDFLKKRTYWKCLCDCGNIVSVEASKLKSGHTKSCGCLNDENRKAHIDKLTTHHMTHTRLYGIWCGMRKRCFNEEDYSYKYYGARGITVCQDWIGENGFLNFRNWAYKNGYSKDLSIDRIDVNGNYEPENCRWATVKEQVNNTRKNIKIMYEGKEYTLSEICEVLGLNYHTMYGRVITKGIPFEIAKDMNGLVMIEYNGKKEDLRSIAKKENVNYRYLFNQVIVNKKELSEAIEDFRKE